MKKILTLCLATGVLIMCTWVLAGCGSSKTDSADWPAMETLGALEASDISSIEYTRATEGGVTGDTVTDSDKIEDIFLRLKEVAIKDKSDSSVADDGLGIKIEAGDKSLNFNFEGDILTLEDGSRYEVENLASLKSYIDKIEKEKDEEAGPSEAMHDSSEYKDKTESQESSGSKDASGSKDYDVSKGFEKQEWQDMEILYFNDFMITMPGNEKWSFEMDGNAVTFYLFSAQQEGYGGRLVTIKAYDMDDNSYEQMPMPYQVAGVGKNVNKRFVAIYPSDLQYNMNDAAQKADYEDLYNYLRKIGEGAVNSPLQTQDSD